MATDQKTRKDVLTPSTQHDEEVLEASLRPRGLSEFVGQEPIKQQLDVFITAAKKRGEQMDHVLFSGPAGLGKTTLAMILASERGVNLRVTSGPAIEKAGDLGAILTNLEEHDVLFIDEIHRLQRVVEETLYAAMEDYVLDVVLGQGPAAKTVRLTLPKFSIVGATTRIGALSSPLRDRFGAAYRLQLYTNDEITTILRRSAGILGIELAEDAAPILAACSRGTPRIANRLLKRARDVASVNNLSAITKDVAQNTLEMLEVDGVGLDRTDRQILTVIVDMFGGGPVGVETIAAAAHEEVETVEGVYEPYLMQQGFVKRTPRGRMATARAYKHLGRDVPEDIQRTLWAQ